MFAHLPDAATQTRLHDLAKAEATRLRNEAVDDFWRGADAVLLRSLRAGQASVERSAARLKARLARHVHGRSTGCPSPLDSGV
ncbi:MAG: hypothetical protein IPI20_10540 [Rhodoferax sp.]|nr:hypothetical protein [Rhodoferax sp.]